MAETAVIRTRNLDTTTNKRTQIPAVSAPPFTHKYTVGPLDRVDKNNMSQHILLIVCLKAKKVRGTTGGRKPPKKNLSEGVQNSITNRHVFQTIPSLIVTEHTICNVALCPPTCAPGITPGGKYSKVNTRWDFTLHKRQDT